MTINDIHRYILFEIDKASRGYINHEAIDDVLDHAQMDEFAHLLPSYGQNQKVHDDLEPFKKIVSYTADNYAALGDLKTGPDGVVVLPSDYLHLIHIRTATKRIEVVNDNEVGDRLDSVIITEPFIYRNGVGGTIEAVTYTTPSLKLHPAQGTALTITYLCRPPKPVFAYSIQNRATVWNQAGSTELAWNDEAVRRIIIRALADLGIHLQAGDIAQFMTAKTAMP